MLKYWPFLPLAALALILWQGPALAKAGFTGFAPALSFKLSLSSNVKAFDASPHAAEAALRRAAPFAGSLGLRLTDKVQLTGETFTRRYVLDFNTREKGFADAQLMFLNLRYEPKPVGRLQPFAMIGTGLAYHDGIVTDSGGYAFRQENGSAGFAWQLGGGLQYHASDDRLYRFLPLSRRGIARLKGSG